MIDIHTHILPEVDDGSNALQTSLEQLKRMQDGGVKTIFLTPHFMRTHYPLNRELIRSKYEELKAGMHKENIQIELLNGREIFLDMQVPAEIESSDLSMGNSSYVLVETNMSKFPADLNDILYRLVIAGYKPIMAHPERYMDIISHPDLAEELLYKNVYLQINAGSLFGNYGKSVQKTAWFLVENGFAHFLASDDHCHRPEYVLPEAWKMISRNIDDHTAKLLTEINPQKMIDNQSIEFFYVTKIVEEKTGFFSKLFKL